MQSETMSLRAGAETSLARPEIENVDGFKFVSFESLEEVGKYLRQSLQSRRRPPRSMASPAFASTSAQSRAAAVKKAVKKPLTKSKNAAQSVSKVGRSATTKPAKPSKAALKAKTASGKKIPVWLKHKRRLRKGDKRVIVDKLHEFVFVSAFTLEDFDKYKDEIDSNVSMVSAGRKRKADSDRPPPKPLSDAKKSKKSTGVFADKVTLTPNPNTSVAPVPDGKNLAKDVAKPTSKHPGQGDVLRASPSQPDLVRLTQASSFPVNAATVGNADEASHGEQVASVPERDASETSSKPKTKSRKKCYPHMQIDEAYNKTVSSSSESDSSIITISDGPEQENLFLDVINVDNESSSAQFIQNSMKIVDEKEGEGGVRNEEKRQEFDKTNKDKTKKKKCRICCLYPSKIVEAKKICPLFGSFFPSYSVSCVSTCKQHPPGEIIVEPSSSKVGFVDSCIQTNAPDIKMHQDFAHRFPHRTIAVTTHCSRMLGQPKPRKKHEVLSKSEHHRTSEQKRREQMHDQFTDLRQIITTSQAKPDNERASKQWILEHAKQVISALDAEDVVLQALHKTLVAKNERLKKRWKELSGKEFDPKITQHKNPSKSPGQTKLINLYKQYRIKNVQRKNAIESTPAESSAVGDNVCGRVESNQGVAASQPKNQSGKASPENLKENTSRPSFKAMSNDESTATAGQLGEEAISSSTASHDLSTSKASQPVVTRNWSEVRRPSYDACTNMNKPSQDDVFPKQAQSYAVAANPGTNNPSETVEVEPSQAITKTSTTSAGMPSQPKTSSIPGPVSNQSAAPAKISTSPAEVVNDPTVAVRMPTGGIAVRMPGRAVTNRFLAVNQPKQAKGTTVNLPTQVIPIRLNVTGSPRLLFPLSKSNQALINNKPTQWSFMSKLSHPEVNKVPLEADVGAVIEVGGGGEPDNHKNDIVLLDVAQTEHKPGSNSGEQVRTLSRIPTSSSINVTLKSVGSITSNKIFNKKPIPSKQRPQVGLQAIQTNQIKNPVQETEASKQKGKALEPMCVQVPQISKTLLAETFQGGKNIVDSINESGLCVISSVFSLSDAKPENSPKPAMGACAKQVSKDVRDNCNSTIHDHNYSKCEAN